MTRLQIPLNGSETSMILQSIALLQMKDVVTQSSKTMKACLPHIYPRSSVMVLLSDLCLEGGRMPRTLVQHHQNKCIGPIYAKQRKRRHVTQRKPIVCVTGIKQLRFVSMLCR